MIEAKEIEEELLGFLRREVFSAETGLTPETDLVAAGFDSMSLVRVLLHVEKRYGFWIPEQEITGEALKNLRTLSEMVCRLLHER